MGFILWKKSCLYCKAILWLASLNANYNDWHLFVNHKTSNIFSSSGSRSGVASHTLTILKIFPLELFLQSHHYMKYIHKVTYLPSLPWMHQLLFCLMKQVPLLDPLHTSVLHLRVGVLLPLQQLFCAIPVKSKQQGLWNAKLQPAPLSPVCFYIWLDFTWLPKTHSGKKHRLGDVLSVAFLLFSHQRVSSLKEHAMKEISKNRMTASTLLMWTSALSLCISCSRRKKASILEM